MEELLIAFSTNDGERLIDDHAGMARYFDVYKFTPSDVQFVERRENSKYTGDETIKHGDPKKAKASLAALENVDVWVNKRFGPNLPRLLKKLLCVVTRVDTIAQAIDLVKANWDAIVAECAKGPERKHLVLKPEKD